MVTRAGMMKNPNQMGRLTGIRVCNISVIVITILKNSC